MASKTKRANELIDLIETGYTHVDARCAEHGATLIPWRLMGPIDLSWTLADLKLRLRCSRCGNRPGQVYPWRQSDAPGASNRVY